jgi:hypothetical protein
MRLETAERGQECSAQLVRPELRLRVVGCGISQAGRIELLGDEINESPPHPVRLQTLRPSTVRAPVPLADAIQAQAPRHHHEPGR